MSLYDYRASLGISKMETSFYALIMSAMRQAGTNNLELLRSAFPAVWTELQARYNAPNGILAGDGLPS